MVITWNSGLFPYQNKQKKQTKQKQKTLVSGMFAYVCLVVSWSKNTFTKSSYNSYTNPK